MAIPVKQRTKSPEGKQQGSGTKEGGLPSRGFLRRFLPSIRPKEIIFFVSQLSLMLEVGTSQTDALRAIGKETQNPLLKEVVYAMLQDIQEGRQLSEAMKRHPRIFDSIFVAMVRAGETGGFLRNILDRILEMQEKRLAMLTQLRSTLTYPAVLCCLAVGVVIFVLVGILPKFAVLFQGKESILPLTTKLMMTTSWFLQTYWWACIAAFVTLALAVRFWKQTDQGRGFVDLFFLSAPIVSRISRKNHTCQLLRTLGHLMESRVPLLESLEVTHSTMKNRFFRRFTDRIADHVRQGGRFSQPFLDDPYVPASVKQMIATGEAVGNLPRVMLRLAEHFDQEVDRELRTLASLMEPVALIVMGAVVGVIVSSVILPLFRIAHAVH